MRISRSPSSFWTLALSAMMVFSASDTFAQSFNFGRPAIKPASGKSRSRIPSAKIPKGVDKQIKRKAKRFKAITLESVNAALKKEKAGSRSRFKAIKANDKIAIGGAKKGARGRGKTLSATQYIKELNKLARGFAAAGYATDGSGPNVNEVGGLDTEPALLKRQRDRLSKAFGKIQRLRVIKGLKLPKVARKGARGKKAYQLLKSAQYQTYKPKAKRGSRGKKPAEYRWEKKQVWGPYGSKKTAAVAVDARIFVLANKDVVKFEATAGADSWIFNKKKTIFRATGSVGGDNRKANGKGEVYAKLSINIIGKNYVLYDKKKSYGLKYAKEKSYHKSFSYKVRFTIVVVPCSLEVGASFKTGIRWSLNVLATRVEAAVTPFINSDAFARFSVDVGVASAGIEGRVTLLDAEAKLHGEAGVSGDPKGLYAYANLAADLGISALHGSINAVATVKWCIFGCKKTYRKKIFSWTGFRKNWNLFKVQAKLYILGKAAGQASASASAIGAGKVAVKTQIGKAVQKPVKTKVSKRVCIKSAKGQFLFIQNNKKKVTATSRRCTAKEAFVVSNDKIYSPYRKTYLSCQSNGRLEGNRTKAASWERIRKVSQGGGAFALHCLAHNKYIVAEKSGGTIVNANRPRVGSWEKFKLVPAP